MRLSDIFKSKKNKTTDIAPIVNEVVRDIDRNNDSCFKVILEQLPTTSELYGRGLVEITDIGLISRLGTLIPYASTSKVSIGNIVNNLKGGNGEILYKVVLEKGRGLVDSKNIPGAKRGFSRSENHINEVADLIPVKQVENKSLIVSNVGSVVMNTASMVVGQYYMNQIDARLSSIKNSVSAINEFLDIQYRSRVESLIESVYIITKYKFSSSENDELRRQEIDKIQRLREKCQEYLYQAESELDRLTETKSSSYETYEKKVKKIEYWLEYQNVLIRLLYQIDMLDFILQLGIKSKEQCFGAFNNHVDKLESIHNRLVELHKEECETYKINLDEGRRKHTGVLALLEKPLSKFNDDWNYKTMSNETLKLIKNQNVELVPISYSDDSLFDKDVTIIVKDGKYFYIPD